MIDDLIRQRKEQGFTHLQLARKMGVIEFTLIKWESGLQSPKKKFLKKWIDALNGKTVNPKERIKEMLSCDISANHRKDLEELREMMK